MQMPADAPGMVITQHIPQEFSKPFADNGKIVVVADSEDAAGAESGAAFEHGLEIAHG